MAAPIEDVVIEVYPSDGKKKEGRPLDLEQFRPALRRQLELIEEGWRERRGSKEAKATQRRVGKGGKRGRGGKEGGQGGRGGGQGGRGGAPRPTSMDYDEYHGGQLLAGGPPPPGGLPQPALPLVDGVSPPPVDGDGWPPPPPPGGLLPPSALPVAGGWPPPVAGDGGPHHHLPEAHYPH
uniref:Uncharacterized protein n=1 Tax=Amphimedon queenslandica TaxID=400682 RepID=A0A1X7VBH1_AMPQE